MEASPSDFRPSDPEAARLRTLEQYDVLDAPPTDAFDRITRLAARLFGVSVAMINFIDQENQWCLSSHGLTLDRTDREVSFCARTIQQTEVMVVPDAREDDRFAEIPLVTGPPHIRFYAGAPLTAPNGYRLGTLCLIDDTPRTFAEEDRETLTDLAGVVMDELTLRHYASDLDASRRAHQETSEQRRRILESITDAFVALDENWTLTYANAQAETLLERPRDELLGRCVWDEFPEAVGSTFQNKYETAVEEERTVEFLEYYPPLDRWLEVKAFPFDGGLSVYFDDVTDRVEAQADLRRERDLTEAILDTSVAALVIVEADGHISFANDRAGEILGRSTEALQGTRHADTGTLADLEENVLSAEEWPFRRILREGTPISDERYVFERPDGTTRSLSVNGAPLYDPDGTIRQVVFSIEDVTDRVQYERELKAAKDEAERANELKAAFLANVTHDLRTPLSSIIGSVEMLAQSAPAECQDSVDRIERSSRRLLETINSVLDLSKLEADAVTPEPTSVDVSDEVLGTSEMFRPQAQDQDVTLTTEVAGDTLPAELDPTMLHRITDNLVGNALKFTDPGGTVVLRAHADPETVTIEVEDTGPGIDEDFLPYLFESFARGESTAQQTGSGLGLPIVKRLTDLMDGTIAVDSEQGVGTTFTVQLPR
ncbi:PAS domain-containing protein [Salinibacter grassmerensis]|uniref:sensor histidine kinase n=1 Tax=Salinibacter grassmerensis TaxID=3040353 RepID=UPI0021E8962C|nr:PAS domain-containing protein [Salinibacter grassmerensis]